MEATNPDVILNPVTNGSQRPASLAGSALTLEETKATDRVSHSLFSLTQFIYFYVRSFLFLFLSPSMLVDVKTQCELISYFILFTAKSERILIHHGSCKYRA